MTLQRFCTYRIILKRGLIARNIFLFEIQNAGMMPDRVPLFGLQLADKQQLVSFFKERGLEIG
jgi:hypothetical protein